MPKNDDKRPVRCSFCGKHQEQVSRIIAGPGAYICNECVQLCMSILEDAGDDVEEERPDIPDVIPTPKEIRDVLEISVADKKTGKGGKKMSRKETEAAIAKLTAEMREAARLLEFEHAAYLRDKIAKLKETL